MTSLDCRLAIRAEGTQVNAYIAPLKTMDGAILIGSLLRSAAQDDPQLFDDWKEALCLWQQRLLSGIVGSEVTSTTRPAPEHERTGDA